eukprot:TRINITY_DN2963_c1_g1_i1.p1 TRINITY_DN2963_c1_g1~~TRINITY_DN2963_c1_g1_i1.p1  ORF type:complete len:234 (-),score=30.78 TRINITY_DN2963_c1_g1_i1:91-792(-)
MSSKDRKSMLDVIQETLEKKGKRTLINRILYVASLTDNLANKKDLLSYYESFFERFRGGEAVVTGLLLVYPQCCCHLVEATQKVINALLEDMNSNTGPNFFNEVKIVASTEDVPERAFFGWHSRVLSTGRTVPSNNNQTVVDYEPEIEHSDILAAETYLNLIKLGRRLSQIRDKSDLDTALDSLRTNFRNFIPSNDRLLSILQLQDIFSLEEFIELYCSPTNLDLDTEIVWTG